MILAVLVSLFLMIISLRDIEYYDSSKGLSKSKKRILIGISILIPFLGFLITRSLRPIKS
jgi:hypothetical protein